jgi:hypothetical protein
MALLAVLAGLTVLGQGLSVPQYAVSPERTVVPANERHGAGLSFWPDGPLGVERSGSGLLFEGPNHGNIARTTGPLTDPAASATPTIRVRGVTEALPDTGYAAGGPIYQDPSSGMRLMFIHIERYPTGNPRGGSYASIGLARSTDGGKSWSFLGQIFTQNLTYDQFKSDPGRCGTDTESRQYGVVNTSFGQYVIRTEGGVPYFYIYGSDTQAPPAGSDVPCPVSFAVARAPVSQVVSAAARGTVSGWSKYFDGSWDEPGLGGRSTDVWPGTRLLSFDVAYDSYLHEYVLVMPGVIDRNRFSLDLSVSRDGVSWSIPRPLFEQRGEIYAPTIVGFGPDPSVAGRSAYIYYTSSPRYLSLGTRWIDGRLQARVLAFP